MEVAGAMGAPAAPRVASGSEYSGTRGTGGVGAHPAVAHCVVGVKKTAPSDLTAPTPVRLKVEDTSRDIPERRGKGVDRGGSQLRYIGAGAAQRG